MLKSCFNILPILLPSMVPKKLPVVYFSGSGSTGKSIHISLAFFALVDWIKIIIFIFIFFWI